MDVSVLYYRQKEMKGEKKMTYTVIDMAGFEFTYDNPIDAFEMVEHIREYLEDGEVITIEVN